jgi:hypothetical protein
MAEEDLFSKGKRGFIVNHQSYFYFLREQIITTYLGYRLLLSFLSSMSNFTCLQNSTQLTKKPSNGPVLHSYFLSSVWYVL